MSVSMFPTSISYALMAVFDSTAINGIPLNSVTLCNGVSPGSSGVLPDSQILSGTSTAGSAVTFPTSSWSFPSRGVCILLNGITIPIRTSPPTNKIPAFVRLGNASLGYRGLDATLDLVRGPDNFVVNSLSAVVANGSVLLRDARLKIQTEGPFSLNNALANAILSNWTGNNSANTGYAGCLLFGFPHSYDSLGGIQTHPIVFDVYNGPIPASANDEATGTKLWTKSVSSSTGLNLFNVSDNSVALTASPSANVTTSGTPTYLRITKASASFTDVYGTVNNYPKMVIQAPIGQGNGYVSFDRAAFVTGQTATLNSFTMLFYPNLS